MHVTTVHHADDTRVHGRECRSLAEAGHDVTLVAPNTPRDRYPGVRYVEVHPGSGRAVRMTLGTLRALWICIRLWPRVVHVHDPELFPAMLLLRGLGIKVIVDVHEDLPAQISSKHWIHPALRPLATRIAERGEPWLLNLADRVVVAEPAVGDRLRRRGLEVATIENFPWPDELAPVVPDVAQDGDQPHFLYVGAVSIPRCADVVVRAIGMTRAPVRLTLAGPMRPAGLKCSLQEVDGWSRTTHVDWMTRSELRSALSDCLAGFAVLMPDPNYIDAQPTKLFEYWSSGVPVIASDFPRLRAIVEEVGGGWLIDPEDAEALAELLDTIIANPEEARRRGRAGRAAILTKYNWTQQAADLVDVYSSLQVGSAMR